LGFLSDLPPLLIHFVTALSPFLGVRRLFNSLLPSKNTHFFTSSAEQTVR